MRTSVLYSTHEGVAVRKAHWEQYNTVWRMWDRGRIPGTGTVIIDPPELRSTRMCTVAVYARVSGVASSPHVVPGVTGVDEPNARRNKCWLHCSRTDLWVSQKPDPERKEPQWREWKVPELRVPCIQANANIVVVEKSEDSIFDYWLRISTLDKGHPLHVPVKLAAYHRQVIEGKTLNTSTTLHQRQGVWWLTLSFDEDVPLQTEPSAPCVGVDVGIANFITTSTGKQYGSFPGTLARRHKRDREKRRRKARLRACLQKKGVETLLSTSSATGQRLGRHVRQEINRAVNLMLADHPNARIIYEELSVASMRFKARSMNAYLYASNLAHIPDQIAWASARRGIAAHTVKAAYSSQECHHCHYPDRANRPNQQTFHCMVCGHRDHADHNAALNVAQRFGDQELAACQNKSELKAVLLRRHDEWKQKHGLAVVQPAVCAASRTLVSLAQ